jgi:hypothetical protein
MLAEDFSGSLAGNARAKHNSHEGCSEQHLSDGRNRERS